MKKINKIIKPFINYTLLLAVGFSQISLALLFPAPVAAQNTETATIYPYADTYVTLTYPREDNSTKQLLLISSQHHSFFKFDLSSIPAGTQIESVQFQYNVLQASNNNLTAYTVSDNSWDPAAIRWDTQPTHNENEVLGTFKALNGTYTPNTADFSKDIVQNYLGGDMSMAAFGETTAYTNPASIDFADSNYHPRLLITYTPNPTPTPEPTDPCPWDIKIDGFIDLLDFAILSADYLSQSPSNPRSNINKSADNIVDIEDFAILSAHFNTFCPAQ